MGKRKPPRPEPPHFKLIEFSAVVRPDEPEHGEDEEWISQADACELVRVTDRTLRNWAEIGLPNRPGHHGKPLYPRGDIQIWADCYREKALYAQRYKRPGPELLTMLEALNWYHIKRAEGFGDNYVVVPNDVTAYDRARMLRLAADGIADSVGESSDADNAWLAEHAPHVPRDYARHDIGWPTAPSGDAA
jgi:hypothetical protein